MLFRHDGYRTIDRQSFDTDGVAASYDILPHAHSEFSLYAQARVLTGKKGDITTISWIVVLVRKSVS